jgi:tetratricopeptide (TPR) repeat protein
MQYITELLDQKNTIFSSQDMLDLVIICYDKAIIYRDKTIKCYKKILELQPSIVAFKKLIGLVNDQAHAYHDKGNSDIRLNKVDSAIKSYDEAIAHYNNVLQLRSNNSNSTQKQLALIINNKADALHDKGDAYVKLNAFDLAIKSYDDAIEHHHKSEQIYTNLYILLTRLEHKTYIYEEKGNVLCKLNEYNQAVECYNHAIKICNRILDLQPTRFDINHYNRLTAYLKSTEALEVERQIEQYEQLVEVIGQDCSITSDHQIE